ncbi:hypothetical protein [Streptomyces sp. NPDC001880]
MHKNVLIVGFGLAVSGAALAGFIASQGSAEGEMVFPRLSSPDKIHAPLHEYIPTPSEDLAMSRAISTAAAQCMQRYGLAPVNLLADPGVLVMASNPAPLYLPRKEAKKYGYHTPSPLSQQPQQAEIAPKETGTEKENSVRAAVMNGWGNTPPKEAIRVYEGRPVTKDGCLGEADAALMNGTRKPRINGGQKAENSTAVLNIILSMKAHAARKMAEDPHHKDMIASWSACMKKAGSPYSGPEEARESTGAATGPTPSAKEVRLAQRDAACQEQVNYLGVTGRLLEKYQEEIARKYDRTLKEVRENIDGRLANAKEITGSTSGH